MPRSSARTPEGRTLILVEDLPVPFDRRVWLESRTLREAGWDVTVVCPKGAGARRWHEWLEGIEIFRYPLPTTAAGLGPHAAEYAMALVSTLVLSLLSLRRGKFDVVHACNPPDFFFPIALLLRPLGARLVYDQHDLVPELYVAQGGRPGGLMHRFLLWCERRTYRLAEAILATNESYRRIAIERGRVPEKRVHIVRSAPDPTRIFPVAPDESLKAGRRHLVVYLGTMGPQDGVELLVEAARAVLDDLPGQVRFVLMGGGNQLGRLRERAAALGLGGDIEFTGRVPDATARAYLATADVAVSPDPANGFNELSTMNKTLEYMAMGRPVVAFDLTETRFSAGEAALYARPNDPADLAARIIELLADPDRRARMGASGRSRVEGPLGWNASKVELLSAYATARSS